MLKVKKLTPDAILPKYQTPGSSGFDISTIEGFTLLPGERAVVRTGLSFEIPVGFEIQIRPRSGIAAKFGITVLNGPGTIDSDYRDELKIILINCGIEPWSAKIGDRICQGVLSPVIQMEIAEIKEFSQEAKDNDRGGGFGSTGIAST